MSEEAIGNAEFSFSAGKDATLRGHVQLLVDGLKKPVLIVCHGFKSFKDWGFFPYMTERFARAGYYTVHFNFSHNGVCERDFDELHKFAINTYSREQEDLRLLLKHLKEGKLPYSGQADLNRIAMLGHSRGGGNVVLFAAEHPEVQAAVTWNGIAQADLFDESFKEEITRNGTAYVANTRTKQNMPINAVFYEDLKANAERYDITSQWAGLKIPALAVQADQDSPRLTQGFETLRQSGPQHTYVTVHEANHTFGAVHPFAGTTPHLEEAMQATLRFLKEHV